MMWFKILLIGLLTVSALLTILEIGEERKPLMHGTAVVNVVVNGLLIAGIIYFL